MVYLLKLVPAHPYSSVKQGKLLGWWHDEYSWKSQSGHVWSSTTTNKRHRRSKTTPFCIYEKLRRRLAGRSGALSGIKGVPEMFSGVRTHNNQPLDYTHSEKFCSCKWHWRPEYFAAQFPHNTKAGRTNTTFSFSSPRCDPDAHRGSCKSPTPPKGLAPKMVERLWAILIVCGSHIAIEEMNRD